MHALPCGLDVAQLNDMTINERGIDIGQHVGYCLIARVGNRTGQILVVLLVRLSQGFTDLLLQFAAAYYELCLEIVDLGGGQIARHTSLVMRKCLCFPAFQPYCSNPSPQNSDMFRASLNNTQQRFPFIDPDQK